MEHGPILRASTLGLSRHRKRSQWAISFFTSAFHFQISKTGG